MQTNQNFRKLFKGQGLALGGYLKQPFREPVPSQASVSMPISGGFQTVRSEAFDHRGIVSFRSAQTLVSGHATDTHLETLVTTVIEGLNILGVVTADRIVARLSGSVHAQSGANQTVTPSGSFFQNLRIAGEPVNCRFVGDAFDELPCDANYLNTLRTSEKFKSQLLPAEGWEKKELVPLSICAGATLGAPKALAGAEGKIEPQQFHFDVPHFGRIYLGEFLVSRNSHTLTMVRVELGCPVDGSFIAGSVEGEPFIMP